MATIIAPKGVDPCFPLLLCVMAPRKMKPKVLIVDDEYYVGKTLQAILERDYEVFVQRDLPSAIRVIEENDIDLLMTDIALPEASGFMLIKAAKKKSPTIPAVVMSLYYNEDSALAQKIGEHADYVLRKPFNLKNVKAFVDDLLMAGVTPEQR